VPVRGFDRLSCGRARPPILPRAPPAGSMQATVLLLHEQPHQEVEQAGDEEHHREKVVAASAMSLPAKRSRWPSSMATNEGFASDGGIWS
jgi:hypothetical protein